MSNIDSAGIERGECDSEGCDCKAFVKGSTGPKCDGCKHAPVRHKELNPKSIQTDPTTTSVDVKLGTPVSQDSQLPQPVVVVQQQQPQPQQQQQQQQQPQPQQQQQPPQQQHTPYCSGNAPPISINDPNHLMQQQHYAQQQQQQHFAQQQQQQQQQMFIQQQLQMGNIRCHKCASFYPEISGACSVCHPRKMCRICNNTPVFMDLSMSEDLQMFEYCTPECRNKDLIRLDKEAGLSQENAP